MLDAYKDRTIITDRYSQSQRPKVDYMETSNKIPTENKITLQEKLFFPVVRYEGLYYSGKENNNSSNYQGKFYYYEPESKYGIDIGNCLIAANKYHAIRFFESLILGNFDEIELIKNNKVPSLLSLGYLLYIADVRYQFMEEPVDLDSLVNNISINEISLDQSIFSQTFSSLLGNETKKKLIIHRLKETKDELTTIMTSEDELSKYTLPIKIIIEYNAAGTEYYVGSDSFRENYNGNMYAKGDYLDQSLVSLAQQYNYDTILLQREVGEYNIVTEIVDCRPNFGHNIYEFTDNQFINKTQIIYKFPLIWTNSKGLYTINSVRQ